MADPHANPFPPALGQAVDESAAAFFKGAYAMSRTPDGAVVATGGAGIMSTISFVGDAAWAFAMSFPEGAAVAVGKAFAGFDIPFDSPDMGDLIGEIANVIAGDISGRLAKKGINAQMSLPTVVRGDDVSMLVPLGVVGAQFAFAGPLGACRFHLVRKGAGQVLPPESTKPSAPAPVAPARTEPAKQEATIAPPPSTEAQAAWEAAMAEAERELAAQDAVEATKPGTGGPGPAVTPSTLAAAHGAPAPLRRWRGYRFVCLTFVFACGGWGAAASLLVLGAHRGPLVASAHDAAHKPDAGAKDLSEKKPLATIDALILAGKFNDGLRACLDAPKTSPEVPAPALALREGFCLEGVGRWGEAANAYRKAEGDPNMAAAVLALLGQSRCAARDESYRLACTLANLALLRAAHPDCRGLPLREEVRHLRAGVGVLEAGRERKDAPVVLSTSASNGLDWLTKPLVAPAPSAARDVLEIHRTLASPGALQVTAALSRRPAIALMRDLAATAGLELRASDDAVTNLRHPSGPLFVDHMPLPELLGILTEGTGIRWNVTADALVLTPATTSVLSK